MKILLNLLIGAPISLPASEDIVHRAVPSSPSKPLATTITVFVSDKIFRSFSRMTRIFQWLVSPSPIPNLFGCTTENISVNVNVENISTKLIIQRLKTLLYKDFVSFLSSLTAPKGVGLFHSQNNES